MRRNYVYYLYIVICLLGTALTTGCSTLTMDFKGQNDQTFHVVVQDAYGTHNISNIMSTYEVKPGGWTKVSQGGSRDSQQERIWGSFDKFLDVALQGLGAYMGATTGGPTGAVLGATAGDALADLLPKVGGPTQ